MAILLCSAETIDAYPTYIRLKDTTIGRSTAVEVSDLNSQDCGNGVPADSYKHFGHCSHVTVM